MGLSKALKANINDAAINVNFSFDGTTTHGQLQAGETFSFENKSATKVYFKDTAGTSLVRVWA